MLPHLSDAPVPGLDVTFLPFLYGHDVFVPWSAGQHRWPVQIHRRFLVFTVVTVYNVATDTGLANTEPLLPQEV